MKPSSGLVVAAIAALSWAPGALAQEGEKSADETAKELANPAGALANLANNFTYTTYEGDLPGASNQGAWSYTFQPVLPFPVGDKGRNITFRPAFKVTFDQPIFDPDAGEFTSLDTNFNDIVFDLVYAGTVMKGQGRGYLWGAGLAGTFPTATHSALGGQQWRFGPELFGGVIRKWGVAGVLVNNQWNVNGGDGEPGTSDQPFNVMTAQYFYGITLGNGWQILSAPVIVYDWNAAGEEALSVPLGTGIARTLKIGGTTWRIQVEAQYYVVKPDSFGSNWAFTLDVRPVIRNPLAGLF